MFLISSLLPSRHTSSPSTTARREQALSKRLLWLKGSGQKATVSHTSCLNCASAAWTAESASATVLTCSSWTPYPKPDHSLNIQDSTQPTSSKSLLPLVCGSPLANSVQPGCLTPSIKRARTCWQLKQTLLQAPDLDPDELTQAFYCAQFVSQLESEDNASATELLVLLTQIAENATSQFHIFRPKHFALLLTGVVKLGLNPTAKWLEQFLAATATQLSSFNCQDYANILHSLGQLKQHVDSQWLLAFQAASARKLPMFEPRQLAAILHGWANLGQPPKPYWMQLYCSAVLQHKSQYKCWEISSTLWALAALSRAGSTIPHAKQEGAQRPLEDHSIEQALAAMAADQAAHFTPQGLANTLHSLAVLHPPQCEQHVVKLLRICSKAAHSFKPQELASVLWALATLQVQLPPAAWQLLLEAASHKAHSFNCLEASMVLWSMSRVAGVGGGEWDNPHQVQLQRMLLRRVEVTLPAASGQHLLCALKTKAVRLDPPSPSFLRTYGTCLAARLAELSLSQVAAVMCCAARVRWAIPRPLLTELLGILASQRSLHQLPIANVVRLAGALTSMIRLHIEEAVRQQTDGQQPADAAPSPPVEGNPQSTQGVDGVPADVRYSMVSNDPEVSSRNGMLHDSGTPSTTAPAAAAKLPRRARGPTPSRGGAFSAPPDGPTHAARHPHSEVTLDTEPARDTSSSPTNNVRHVAGAGIEGVSMHVRPAATGKEAAAQVRPVAAATWVQGPSVHVRPAAVHMDANNQVSHGGAAATEAGSMAVRPAGDDMRQLLRSCSAALDAAMCVLLETGRKLEPVDVAYALAAVSQGGPQAGNAWAPQLWPAVAEAAPKMLPQELTCCLHAAAQLQRSSLHSRCPPLARDALLAALSAQLPHMNTRQLAVALHCLAKGGWGDYGQRSGSMSGGDSSSSSSSSPSTTSNSSSSSTSTTSSSGSTSSSSTSTTSGSSSTSSTSTSSNTSGGLQDSHAAIGTIGTAANVHGDGVVVVRQSSAPREGATTDADERRSDMEAVVRLSSSAGREGSSAAANARGSDGETVVRLSTTVREVASTAAGASGHDGDMVVRLSSTTREGGSTAAGPQPNGSVGLGAVHATDGPDLVAALLNALQRQLQHSPSMGGEEGPPSPSKLGAGGDGGPSSPSRVGRGGDEGPSSPSIMGAGVDGAPPSPFRMGAEGDDSPDSSLGTDSGWTNSRNGSTASRNRLDAACTEGSSGQGVGQKLREGGQKPREGGARTSALAMHALAKLGVRGRPELVRVLLSDLQLDPTLPLGLHACVVWGASRLGAQVPGSWWQRQCIVLEQCMGRYSVGELAMVVGGLSRAGLRGAELRNVMWGALEGKLRGSCSSIREVCMLAVAWAAVEQPLTSGQLHSFQAAARQQLPVMDTRSLPHLIYAFAKLGAPPDPAWVAEFVDEVDRQQDGFAPQDIVMVLWALARLGTRMEAAGMNTVLRAVHGMLGACSAQEVATVILSSKSLGCTPSARFLAAAEQQLSSCLQAGAAGPEALAEVLRAFVAIQHVPSPDWMAAYLTAASTLHSRNNPSQLARQAHALLSLKQPPTPQWLASFRAAVRRSCREATPQQAALIASSLAKLDASEDTRACLAALAEASEQQLCSFSPQGLSMLAAALVSAQVSPREAWLCSFCEAALPQLQSCTPQSLSVMIHALASLRFHPGPSFLTAYLIATHRLLPRFTPRGLSLTIRALSRLGVQPSPPWLSTFLEVASQQLGSFWKEHLVDMIYALAVLRQRPGQQWLGQFREAFSAAERVQRMGPDEAAEVRWALHVLGAES